MIAIIVIMVVIIVMIAMIMIMMIMMIMMMLPIVVVLAAKVMTQGVAVHRPAQPVPSLLVHVTYSANSYNDKDSTNRQY